MLRSCRDLAIFASLLLNVGAQSTPTVICTPGQCLQGYSNTTIGAKLSAPGIPLPIHLLPGIYTSTTSPQLLHDALTSSSSTLSSSPGFTSSNSTSISLPLSLTLQPGLSVFSDRLYAGTPTFQPLPPTPLTNTSVPFTSVKSLSLSPNVWIAVSSGSDNTRTIVWDSVPDIAQLPSPIQGGALALTDIQSAACSPGCSAQGVCTPSGTCQCLPNFTGASCEACAKGFFGPTCQACPANCKQCDEGVNGSGRCLLPLLGNDPAGCTCKNGVCGTDGTCVCSAGFTTGDDGLKCSKCAEGFFEASNGDCQVCQLGCTSCAPGTGACLACKPSFQPDANDRTKCTPPVQSTSSGVVCPSGSFPNGDTCAACSKSCETCTGGTDRDCIVCAQGLYALNGQCVKADSDGVCEGTSLIADNNKKECDGCGAKCTKCKIPNFSVASTVNQKQCTACLPGFVLDNGACVQSCPSGTTVSSQDNLTCVSCDTSCASCGGTPTFCLSCPPPLLALASSGKCVSSCPSGTFLSSGACLPCHPDCTSCSGASFNQCTACPASRPVLAGGRCLPTCAKDQFFDKTTGVCGRCDPKCGSCAGSGPARCLACSSPSEVLRGGSCVSASAAASTTSASGCKGGVIQGLGVCLDELVASPTTTQGAAVPFPSVTGLDAPTVPRGRKRLEWWEILLMALGCAFVLVGVLWCCRRRRQRQGKGEGRRRVFLLGVVGAEQKKEGWRLKLRRWKERVLGHVGSVRWRAFGWPAPLAATKPKPKPKSALKSTTNSKLKAKTKTTVKNLRILHLGPAPDGAYGHGFDNESEDVKLGRLRAAEEARSYAPAPGPGHPRVRFEDDASQDVEEEEDMVRLIGSYNRPAPAPPVPPKSRMNGWHTRITPRDRDSGSSGSGSDSLGGHDMRTQREAPSIYSQMTGVPRRGPDVRMPVRGEGEASVVGGEGKDDVDWLMSRFSGSTFEERMRDERAVKEARGSFWK